MKRIVFALTTLGVLGTLGALSPAQAQEVVIMPPAFVATATPVYFEGRAAYWYNDHWCYRMGDHWEYYRQEPPYLGRYRVEHPPVHRYYEGRGYAHVREYRRR